MSALFALSSCNNEKTQSAPSAAVQKTATIAGDKALSLPIIPNEKLLDLWHNCQMIDYLFHDLPFSMSQDESASIQTNLTYIGPEPVTEIPANCKIMARQFYQVGGDITIEADIYFSEGCHFYIFYEKSKPIYANQMNETGIKFFNTMINQAMQARKNAQAAG